MRTGLLTASLVALRLLVSCSEEIDRDAGFPDANGVIRDGGPTDSGQDDAAAPADSGADAGADDAAPADAGSADATPADAAGTDAGPDAGRPDGGGGTGACAGLPCRDGLQSDLDFESLARPSPEGGCQFDLEILFLTPVDGAAPLQATYYIDALARRHVLDFVRFDQASTYAALNVDQYFRTFEREDLKIYHVGRIRRLIPVGGQPIQYGFEVFGSGYWGGPMGATGFAAIRTNLLRTFGLPLGYAPGTYNSIQQAGQLVSPGFDVHLPITCPGESCPAGNGPCLIIPNGAELCGQFSENRSIQGESTHRMRVGLAPGNHRLVANQAIGFVSSGTYGPTRAAVNAGAGGTVVTQNIGGTIYWSIQQTVTSGANTIALELSLYSPTQPLIMREPFLAGTVVFGAVNGGTGQDDRVQLESCAPSGLPSYFAEADLGSGDHILLEYRHQLPFAGSGPLVPVGADVTLTGQSRRVEGYESLLYAGVHHNWDNQFWILFDTPMSYLGHPVYGLWIDEAGYMCCPVDSIRTLDANLQPLDTIAVGSYLRSPNGF